MAAPRPTTTNLGSGIFEQACRKAGMEGFMIAMVGDRPAAGRLLDVITDLLIEAACRYFDEIGPFLDVYQYGDDFATQASWMISPDSSATLIKPRQRRLFDSSRSGWTPKKTQRAFGLRPTPLEESVLATVEWYRGRAAKATSRKSAGPVA
jgi:hypothetical protein